MDFATKTSIKLCPLCGYGSEMLRQCLFITFIEYNWVETVIFDLKWNFIKFKQFLCRFCSQNTNLSADPVDHFGIHQKRFERLFWRAEWCNRSESFFIMKVWYTNRCKIFIIARILIFFCVYESWELGASFWLVSPTKVTQVTLFPSQLVKKCWFENRTHR